MKQKKGRNLKGFTLIELLAVIVILAIIVLIAVPQVLKILNKARKSAAEDSTYGIVKAAETYVTNFMLKNNGTLPSEELVFNCNGTSCDLQTTLSDYNLEGLDSLDFKGTKPKSGKVIISNSGNNIQVSLVINNYGCSYVNEKSGCSLLTGSTSYTPTDSDIGYTGVLKVVYLDPTNLDKGCNENNVNSDTGTKIGCMKWYTYNDDGTNYTMILDHNTTAIIDNWNSRNTQLSLDTDGWVSNLNPRLITKNEIDTITEYNSSTPYNFETKSNQVPSPYPTIAKYGWLFDRTHFNCTSFGCLNNATGNDISNMIGYWTDIPNEPCAWNISCYGRVTYSYLNIESLGIRPVITVPKNKIS